MQFVL